MRRGIDALHLLLASIWSQVEPITCEFRCFDALDEGFELLIVK